MSDEHLVHMLYGNPTPPATPATGSPLDDLAAIFYPPDAAPPPAAQPAPGEWFDRYAALKSDLGKHADALHDTLGLSAEARDADQRAFVKLADEIGLDDQTLLSLHQEVVRGLTQTPPADANDTAAMQTHNVEIRQRLREQLGEAATADVIARTQRFIDAHTEVRQLVESAGIGTRAEPFLLLADHVRRTHYR